MRRTLLLITFLAVLPLSGCASMSRLQKGALLGGGSGAAIGAVIGNMTGSPKTGAAIGAGVGALTGAIIGRQLDQQAEALEVALEDAEVRRVGDHIEVTFAAEILFDFDSDRLRSHSELEMARLAKNLLEHEHTMVTIIGHTDSVGADDYNRALSVRRAESAARAVLSRGVYPGRVQVAGRGESEPVASNATEMGRQQNRRVEVHIAVSEAYRAELARAVQANQKYR